MGGEGRPRKDTISAQVVFCFFFFFQIKRNLKQPRSTASLPFVINYFSEIYCSQFPSLIAETLLGKEMSKTGFCKPD